MNDIVLIEVSGLTVRYGEKTVLSDLELSVRAGEFVSIVGQSGSGKTSLLLALAGLIDYEGNVRVPSDIGFVFQNYAVFPWMTVWQNVAFGLHDKTRQKLEELTRQHLALVGLTEKSWMYPAQLSGGQVQRVALARALAPNPPVVFLDEPFGSLDTYTRDRMQTWLMEIHERERKTMLFITHNVEEAIFLSDRVLLLSQGKILDGFPPLRFDRPRTESIRFHPEFIELKRQIVEQITVS
jgi:NitT/TauT family transport system ATP-binding protein